MCLISRPTCSVLECVVYGPGGALCWNVLSLSLSFLSMSSEAVNDENRGVQLVHKHVPSDSAADIFALDQPTGRPSILRPSQAENLNKNIPKGVKV